VERLFSNCSLLVPDEKVLFDCSGRMKVLASLTGFAFKVLLPPDLFFSAMHIPAYSIPRGRASFDELQLSFMVRGFLGTQGYLLPHLFTLYPQLLLKRAEFHFKGPP